MLVCDSCVLPSQDFPAIVRIRHSHHLSVQKPAIMMLLCVCCLYAPRACARVCSTDSVVQLYILVSVASNPTELERKLDFISLLSRIACIDASRSSLSSFVVSKCCKNVTCVFFRLALLQKFRQGQFVSAAEKEAFVASCPTKWRSLFQTSLSLHHLLACFKMYDNISIDALRQRMDCSEDDCIKCAPVLLLLAA